MLGRVDQISKIPAPAPQPPPIAEQPNGTYESALEYLDNVHAKIDKLVSDFAAGLVNRTQFRELYAHYQNEVKTIRVIVDSDPQSWQDFSSEGQSMAIRRQHSAKAQAYAIYENVSGLPLSTIGHFKLDPDLLIPMLSSYRAATREIFGAGIQTSQIEDGDWICFVAGEYTTMLAVFTNEPAAKQLDFLGDLHAQFEGANKVLLQTQPIPNSQLIFPHEYFLGKWKI
jgi:hypothetical protein